MSDVTILAVDPDPSVLAYFRRAVSASGYRFVPARRGDEGLKKARASTPDAIVARVNLPDMTGREFVSKIREEGEPLRSRRLAPILLTALRGQEAEVAEGLEFGAMNVLFFPFKEGEFATRLGSLLRWAHRPANEGVLTVGPVSVDLERGELLLPQSQALTASELEILRWLLNPPGRAVTRRQIPVGTERAVDVHVASLRSKLGAAGSCIETLRGIGYRFRNSAAAL